MQEEILGFDTREQSFGKDHALPHSNTESRSSWAPFLISNSFKKLEPKKLQALCCPNTAVETQQEKVNKAQRLLLTVSIHLLLGSKSWGCHQGYPVVQGQVLIHLEIMFLNSCLVDKEIPRLGDEESCHQLSQIPCTIMAKNHRGKASTKRQTIHRSSITLEEHLLLYLSSQPETQHFKKILYQSKAHLSEGLKIGISLKSTTNLRPLV